MAEASFSAKDGTAVGNPYSIVYFLGDNDGCGAIVKDETEKMILFRKKINQCREIKEVRELLAEIDHKHDMLDEIHAAAVKIKGMLER